MINSDFNNITIKAYSGTAEVINSELENASNLTFSTVYPGGLFNNCQFYVPRDVTAPWMLAVGHKIIVRNELKTVWEGRVTSISIAVQAQEQGQRVTCLGYWGDVLMVRKWRKWWADTRVGNDVMRKDDDTPTENFWEIEQDFGHLEIFPKEVTFTSGDYLSITYSMPTGENVKRITYGYDFNEDTQQWEQVIHDPVAAADIAASSIVATATGTHDITLATPRQVIEFRMYARANNSATWAKKVKAEWENLTIYSETGAINLTEIAKDVRAHVTELSASETLISSNTFSLVPFISEIDTCADILINAAAYGDASFNAWAVGVRESDLSTDGKPILFVEQYPVLTDYDYRVSIGADNFQPGFEAEQDITDVINWVAVTYTDESGKTVVLTPDDDANLKDASSIALYGERQEWLDINTTSATTATNYARRYLAARKLPQWRVSSGLSVRGYVMGKGETVYPVSEIRAGKRIKIENYLSDINGTGLTLLITGTDYSDNNETCRISVGKPDTMDVWLAQTIK